MAPRRRHIHRPVAGAGDVRFAPLLDALERATTPGHMVLLLLLWIVAPTSLDALATTAAPRSVINSRRRMAPSEGNASTNVRTVPLCSLTGRNCSNLPKDIIRPNVRCGSN